MSAHAKRCRGARRCRNSWHLRAALPGGRRLQMHHQSRYDCALSISRTFDMVSDRPDSASAMSQLQGEQQAAAGSNSPATVRGPRTLQRGLRLLALLMLLLAGGPERCTGAPARSAAFPPCCCRSGSTRLLPAAHPQTSVLSGHRQTAFHLKSLELYRAGHICHHPAPRPACSVRLLSGRPCLPA